MMYSYNNQLSFTLYACVCVKKEKKKSNYTDPLCCLHKKHEFCYIKHMSMKQVHKSQDFRIKSEKCKGHVDRKVADLCTVAGVIISMYLNYYELYSYGDGLRSKNEL